MVVQFASQIVNLMGYDILASGPADIDPYEVAPIQQLNLKPERIAEAQGQVAERMQVEFLLGFCIAACGLRVRHKRQVNAVVMVVLDEKSSLECEERLFLE